MKPIRILCMLLAVSLLLLLAACHNTDPTPTPETGDTATGSTEGLSTPLRYAEVSLPAIPDLADWYADAVDREQLTNALLYSEKKILAVFFFLFGL